ncbi:uncharacterized protein LOC109546482 isoform X2 [Dendroctonus ponderosae]|uniref:Protein sleepless n=1 Tax=Dendroctonus ponderosae TaxID=77166 RepID=A0AAR5QIG9_DENPD|nr:uncharacterized protein LOC109546482 isoform X2 [Dendroctonus ponderosae]
MFAKMSTKLIGIVGISLILSCHVVTASIMCYNCSSPSDGACGDPYKGTNMVECNDGETCIKVVGTYENVNITYRQCNPAALTCELHAKYLGSVQYCEECSADHCNFSSRFELASFLIVAAFLTK